MKTKTLILFAILAGLQTFVALQAQDLPDTVWTKTFQNPISINCVKFSPDGQYIFAGTNNIILQIETATGNIFRTLSGHKWKVLNLDFSPTGDTIISSGADYTIRLWKYSTGDSIYSFKYDIPDSLDIQLGEKAYITPDGKRIISLTNCYGDNYDNVYVFDILTKELIGRAGNYYGANKLSISADGKYFAIAAYPNQVALYDLNTYELIKVLGSHESELNDIAFSPDGKMVASCGEDWRIYVWDTETRELIHEFGSNTHVKNVVFSNDSKFIIWSDGGGDYTMQVWSIDNKEKVYQYPFSGFTDIDISYNDLLVTTSSQRISLLNPKWSVNDIEDFYYQENALIIFPNPASEYIEITVGTRHAVSVENKDIQIYNVYGECVSNLTNAFVYTPLTPLERGIIVDVSGLADGMYFVRIGNQSKLFVKY
ncbi:MAG: T9SS type A sorting domain-containing protein [bacterium]